MSRLIKSTEKNNIEELEPRESGERGAQMKPGFRLLAHNRWCRAVMEVLG